MDLDAVVKYTRQVRTMNDGLYSLGSCQDDYSGTMDGQMFRVIIDPEMKACYQRLFSDTALMGRLFAAGLIRTELLGTSSEGYMVLRHERFRHQSFFYEWTYRQIKDVVMMVLALQKTLHGVGCYLIDPNTYNTTLDMTRPLYFDFASIRPGICPPYSWLRSFWMGGNIMQGWRDKLHISFAEMQNVLGRSALETYDAQIHYVAELQHEYGRSEWTLYDKRAFHYDDASTWQAKHSSVRALMALLPTVPESVTDLGCNTGDYCHMMLRLGVTRVCGIDIDESAVSELYRRSKANDLPITAVLGDFYLSYNHFCGGTRNVHTMGDPRMDRYRAQNRFASDLVLMVSMIHHLCYWRSIGMAELAQVLAGYVRRWLIIEWIPFTDAHLEGSTNHFGDDRSSYTEENFLTVMKTFFPRPHTVLLSSPTGRKMYLFEKG